MTSLFDGKVCVITGAASGIGRALALRLAGDGALLALSDVDAAGLDETKTIIGAASNRVRTDILDVADEHAIEVYPELVKQSLGNADYVFNVAGLARVGTFDETPLSSFEKVMDVNFWGVVRMSKAFLPHLLETKGGLVNISSLFGLIGFPGQVEYCASKFGVRGFSEALALELKEAGVSVTSAHPGGVATNIMRNATVDALPKRFENRDEANAEFDKLARTSPERAAEIILNGVTKRRQRVIVGPDARIASFIQRLFPQRYSEFLKAAFENRLARDTK